MTIEKSPDVLKITSKMTKNKSPLRAELGEFFPNIFIYLESRRYKLYKSSLVIVKK